MSLEVTWHNCSFQEEEGVLIAADRAQEWMLPWWWENYSRWNRYPVLFVDLGMTEESKRWCQNRGELVSLPFFFTLSKEETPPELALKWERCYGNEFWKARACWFKKPLAMLQTIYRRTLWLDLDCEVTGPLSCLFAKKQELLMALEPDFAREQSLAEEIIEEGEKLFNSGVVLFTAGGEALPLWARTSIGQAPHFWTDQHVVSRLQFQKQIAIEELPPIYNWRMAHGHNKEARIIHWVGDLGKKYIRLRHSHFM